MLHQIAKRTFKNPFSLTPEVGLVNSKLYISVIMKFSTLFTGTKKKYILELFMLFNQEGP